MVYLIDARSATAIVNTTSARQRFIRIVDVRRSTVYWKILGGLLDPGTSGETRVGTLQKSQLMSIDWLTGLIVAFAICVLLSVISLLVPPFIETDSASGFLTWRGTLLGEFNSIIEPDHADIAKDAVHFLTVWSPG